MAVAGPTRDVIDVIDQTQLLRRCESLSVDVCERSKLILPTDVTGWTEER